MMRSPSLSRALAPSRRFSRGLFCWTAAAALTSSAHAFAPVLRSTCHSAIACPTVQQQRVTLSPPQQQTVRLYASRKDNDDSLLGKAAGAVKSILPKKWFRSEEEKKAELARKQVQNEIKGGLKEILRDAPLPVKMMGSMIAPLMSGMASTLAESVGEQQRQMSDLLDDARTFIARDAAATKALGEPIVVQSPFSQSSSTTSINGKTTSQIQAAFSVQGYFHRGTATMTATDQGISSLVLQVAGRSFNIDVSSTGSGGGGGSYSERLGKNKINQDDIIDVEFVEKEVEKK